MEKKLELGPGIWGETILISFWNGEYNRILLTKFLKCKCKIDFLKNNRVFKLSIRAIISGSFYMTYQVIL